jgi:lipopolysaccharide transport system permease protein
MSDLAVRVYTPESSLSHPRIMLRDMFFDLRRSFDPALRLAVRDIRASHRQAFLGILWAFIMPLANTVTWVFLSYAGIISVGDTELPYAVYVFTGTMLWSIFTDAMGSPMAQTSSAGGLLTKLNFPREALVLTGLYKSLFHTAIKASMLIAALVVVGLNPGWGLLLFPLGILSLMLVGTVLGLLITPFGMLYVDVGRVVGFGMQFLMYVSPVVFPMPKEGWAAVLFTINPLSPLILMTRNWLTGFPPEYLTYFLAVNAVALALLLVVWVAYRLALPIIVERMSA